MSEEKTVKFADSIWVNLKPEVLNVGPMTEVRTLAHMAAIAKRFRGETLKFKPGDRIEWEITLSGRTTVDQRMIEQAIDQHIR